MYGYEKLVDWENPGGVICILRFHRPDTRRVHNHPCYLSRYATEVSLDKRLEEESRDFWETKIKN